ncbi:glycosyltransferase family 4 protein [Bosea sp. F3-2]|uniref:glycosyltransferase family 4 protein n=1 Tax=Bosea sp. F3-2 TaxID=2599640 RepID=UPI0011ED243B|nr:glycosyltransferase family 4 protein [Bosea sp. F3-2]QEL23970.1 glycosyltransferase family 4 protein [Bosea sp. F3-2]
MTREAPRKRILLLTDIPPCSNLTAGIVTAQMCRFLPKDELAIFCVMNPHLRPMLCDDLAGIEMKTVRKPTELQRRVLRGIRVGRAGAAAIEAMKRIALPRRLIRQAIAYGRAVGATDLWAILQGQTMVRIAAPVARGLGVPLRVHVWDPLRWWLDAHGVDPVNRRLDLALFDRTLQQAASCAAASIPMARHYEETYGVPSTAVIASIDPALAQAPPPKLISDDSVVIGMVGQFYASEEWAQLVTALKIAKWRVGERKVVLMTFGHERPPNDVPDEHLRFMGWMDQPEVIRTLAEHCDIAYCPYPFAERMAEVSRLSFPSKVPTYLAAGRPILFHGPSYSAPYAYLNERGAAYLCRDLYPSAVYNGLAHLIEDSTLYEATALAARGAFLADFTLPRMERAVRRFLGYEGGKAGQAHGLEVV